MASRFRLAWLLAVGAAAAAVWLKSGVAQVRTPTVQAVAQRLNLTPAEVQGLEQSGYSLQRLSLLTDQNVPKIMRRMRYPEIQRLRAEFDARQYRPSGEQTPAGAASRALNQFRQLQMNAERPRAAGIPVGQPARSRGPQVAGISTDGWKWLGPPAVGGRTRAIVIHPNQPNTIWLGSTGGGVWRSDDGGASWAPLDNAMSNLVISCMAMLPGKPDCLVAGTGESIYETDWDPVAHGDGIFVTQDGGRTWKQPAATVSEDFDYVRKLAFSADGKVLLAATRKGVFRSTDLGESWAKTADYSAGDVDFHPSNSQEALAAGWNNGQIYFSSDGGASWTASDVPEFKLDAKFKNRGRVELTYAAADASIVYALVNANEGVICRSGDGGRSFAAKDISDYQVFGTPNQGQYDNTIWAGDPQRAQIVVVGGVDLFRSEDSGQTLQLISNWGHPESAHADQHCIVAHPRYDGVTNRSVYFGNDGGVYRTDDIYQTGGDPDRAQGWVSLNRGYGVTQFDDVACNPQTGTLIAGAQDNGTFRYTQLEEAGEWTRVYGGDGGVCAADPNDPTLLYGEYVFLELFRTSPTGKSVAFINGIRTASFENQGAGKSFKPFPYQIPDAASGRVNFIAPFVIDPSDTNRILAGGLSLWRTNDAKAEVTIDKGPRWARIKPAIAEPQDRYYYPLQISAIAIARDNSDVIWVGHNNGEIYRTTNGTAPQPAWRRLGIGSLPQSAPQKNYWCQSIVIDPHDNQRVFVTFLSFTRENVWLTKDGGETWKNVSTTLPEAGVRTVAIHPRRPEWVYLGTEVGVFASEDGGLTWSPANQGPANCRVDKLTWLGEKLIAATFGRGIYCIEVKP